MQRFQNGPSGHGFDEIDGGEAAERRAERYLDTPSLRQPPATISQSLARQQSPVATDAARAAMALVGVIACAGFALTIVVFYPGYLTRDATFVRGYVQTWHLGDWQSPLMTIVW